MKLDLTLLPYFSIIWFLFGLSRASYNSAYISGMKDDLGFKGKDFNYMTTTYLVVYAVCQIPGTSLLTIYSPTYVFVAANLTWSVLVGYFPFIWSDRVIYTNQFLYDRLLSRSKCNMFGR